MLTWKSSGGIRMIIEKEPTKKDEDIAWGEEVIRNMRQDGIWCLPEPLFVHYQVDHANKTVRLLTPLASGFASSFHEHLKRAFSTVGWETISLLPQERLLSKLWVVLCLFFIALNVYWYLYQPLWVLLTAAFVAGFYYSHIWRW